MEYFHEKNNLEIFQIKNKVLYLQCENDTTVRN